MFNPQEFCEQVYGYAYFGGKSAYEKIDVGQGVLKDVVSDVEFPLSIAKTSYPTCLWKQVSVEIRTLTLDGGEERLATNFEAIVTVPPVADRLPSDLTRRLNAFDFAIRTIAKEWGNVFDVIVAEEDANVGDRKRISRAWQFSVSGEIVGEEQE